MDNYETARSESQCVHECTTDLTPHKSGYCVHNITYTPLASYTLDFSVGLQINIIVGFRK